jgi:Ni,Fe-hydrogenase III large subunit/Ni,Fe-hydrogenase III component G
MTPRVARDEVAVEEFRAGAERALARAGWRFGHETVRVLPDGRLCVELLLLEIGSGAARILSTSLPAGATGFPSLTPHVPAAHWAERAMGDLFGLQAEGHPRWKGLLLHEAWPEGFAPLRGTIAVTEEGPRRQYSFLQVQGEGVHEIPVGPIHAGIIEPGHFRFSCQGEVITNLEIRLGYQHRGVERRLREIPWQQARFLAEAASSDTAVGNALAHSVAVEQLLGVEPPPRAEALRTVALEVERLANHLGDLGALSGDIGYSAGATLFSRLRGAALGLGEMLTGSRLQRGYVRPGGVTRDLDSDERAACAAAVSDLARRARDLLPLVLQHPGVIERMEGTGRVTPSLAREFGLVGPAARASGSEYDARWAFPHGMYPGRAPTPAAREAGDVLARAEIRGEEIRTSLAILATLVDDLPPGSARVPVKGSLPPEAVAVGVVEAWRGELIHWITTDAEGQISRYAIKDPSFNNWTGLAIAVRGNLVADFPLCNKSFNLSYSGNDL